ncbi:MAG: hypothetical protein IPJ00_11005 [Saprospirales bacterium]|nr:hypothetical protein [Saprospirales bacterium]
MIALNWLRGASISFSYELNELPRLKRAGIRGAEMTESSPFDMPARNTYIYKDPSVINTPIRIFQHPENYYYHRIEPSPVNPLSLPEDVFEEKVVCTSTPQNQVFQNKNAMVGYALVAEFWDDT